MINRFTDLGLDEFTKFLYSTKSGSNQEFPKHILNGHEYVENIGGDSAWLDGLSLDDSLEAAKGLDDIVTQLDISTAQKDSMFWTWCSAYLFERLCNKNKAGGFKTGEMPIWILEPNNWQRYYRHYLASIWQVYSAHKKKDIELQVLLGRPVNTPGELWAQIAATKSLIINSTIIDAVYHLYWDEEGSCRKRGSGGESPRRLTQVLKQFSCTYDFFSMSGGQLVGMLPSEFNRFKS